LLKKSISTGKTWDISKNMKTGGGIGVRQEELTKKELSAIIILRKPSGRNGCFGLLRDIGYCVSG
jgi:hypothetical protein